MADTLDAAGSIRFGTPAARWVVAATVLGSGVAFLDGTVVNVAMPAIGEDLDAGITGLQWVLDSYLVTLSSLLLLGGSLGDLYGRRRVYQLGLAGFALTSLGCALAPNIGALIAARAVQGVAAAMLVPGSLAILSAVFLPDDRARAVGAWSGLGGVATAIGPFAGGWLIDSASWRWIFVINLPIAAAAYAMTAKHVPETRDRPGEHMEPDFPGAIAVSLGLAGACYALIEGPVHVNAAVVAAGVIGVGGIVAFVLIEQRSKQPMLPLDIFKSAQFTGANLTTFAVYSGLGAAFFLLTLQLQLVLGYSALEAGASLLPVTLCMLLLSARAGALAQRIGPRLPMTVGPLVVALGLLLFTRVDPGQSYFSAVLPAALVFGLGLATTVAPLTSAVLAAVDDHHLGVGSGVNNAVSRVAGLLAVAVLPAVAGLDTGSAEGVSDGFATAMVVAAVLCAAGGAVAFLTVRTGRLHAPVTQASVLQPCHAPCVASDRAA